MPGSVAAFAITAERRKTSPDYTFSCTINVDTARASTFEFGELRRAEVNGIPFNLPLLKGDTGGLKSMVFHLIPLC